MQNYSVCARVRTGTADSVCRQRPRAWEDVWYLLSVSAFPLWGNLLHTKALFLVRLTTRKTPQLWGHKHNMSLCLTCDVGAGLWTQVLMVAHLSSYVLTSWVLTLVSTFLYSKNMGRQTSEKNFLVVLLVALNRGDSVGNLFWEGTYHISCSSKRRVDRWVVSKDLNTFKNVLYCITALSVQELTL